MTFTLFEHRLLPRTNESPGRRALSLWFRSYNAPLLDFADSVKTSKLKVKIVWVQIELNYLIFYVVLVMYNLFRDIFPSCVLQSTWNVCFNISLIIERVLWTSRHSSKYRTFIEILVTSNPYQPHLSGGTFFLQIPLPTAKICWWCEISCLCQSKRWQYQTHICKNY